MLVYVFGFWAYGLLILLCVLNCFILLVPFGACVVSGCVGLNCFFVCLLLVVILTAVFVFCFALRFGCD